MSVACIAMPAAELIRPAGMKPASMASWKRRSQWTRFSGASAAARARATRSRTSVMVCSLPFAYFSSSASRQISCSGSGARAMPGSSVFSEDMILDFLGGVFRIGYACGRELAILLKEALQPVDILGRSGTTYCVNADHGSPAGGVEPELDGRGRGAAGRRAGAYDPVSIYRIRRGGYWRDSRGPAARQAERDAGAKALILWKKGVLRRYMPAAASSSLASVHRCAPCFCARAPTGVVLRAFPHRTHP
jgi:hypothetical protein